MDKIELGQHILSRYNEDLEQLRTDVLQMGGLAESQLRQALQALATSDADLAAEVASLEVRVNQMEVDIDEECNRTLATRAPAASDLRLVIAIIKTITDLERVGDEAHKIANIVSRRSGLERGGVDGYRIVRHLGNVSLSLLHDALDVFARLDAPAAIAAVRRDRQVDEEYDAIQRQCMTFMIEDPRTIRAMIDLMWVARALERIGDHAKNICEYVIYMVGGRDVRHVAIEDVERQLGGRGAGATSEMPPPRRDQQLNVEQCAGRGACGILGPCRRRRIDGDASARARQGPEFLLRHPQGAEAAQHADRGPARDRADRSIRAAARARSCVASIACTICKPGARYEGSIILQPENIDLVGREVDPIDVRMRIGMVFQKAEPVSRCRSPRTSTMDCGCVACAVARNCPRRWSRRCAAPRCGMRSRTA